MERLSDKIKAGSYILTGIGLGATLEVIRQIVEDRRVTKKTVLKAESELHPLRKSLDYEEGINPAILVLL